MTKELTTFNPWLSENKEIDGWVDIKNMPNLLETQARKEGKVDLEIILGVSKSEKSAILEINIKTRLDFICQRCMGLIEGDEFETNSTFLVLRTDRNKNTDRKNIDIIVCEKKLDIVSLVEQELILSAPMIAKHEDCGMNYKNELVERENPFANLLNVKLKN